MYKENWTQKEHPIRHFLMLAYIVHYKLQLKLEITIKILCG